MKQQNRNFSWILWILAFLVINSIVFVLATASPKFEFSVQEQENTNQVQVSILRTSFFPFSKIEVLLDDTPLELTKISDKVYSAIVSTNGTLEIKTTNFNGMQKNSFERVGTIDDTPPNVYGEFTAIGEVTVKLEDVQSGIHYEAIYALANDSDETILPAEIDMEKQQVVFRFPGGILEVHIFDMLGNEAISTFDDSTSHTQGNVDIVEVSSSSKTKESSSQKETTVSSAKTKESSTQKTKESSSAGKKESSSVSQSQNAAKTQSTSSVQSSSSKALETSKTSSATTKSSQSQSVTSTSKSSVSTSKSVEATSTAKASSASKNSETTAKTTSSLEAVQKSDLQNNQAPSTPTEPLIGPGANTDTTPVNEAPNN